MKSRFLLVLLGLIACSTLRGESPSSAGGTYTPESHTYSEVFTSKVLKVYSFQDGDADYVAYVVNWKDHEVVVTPSMTAGTKYNVGDAIRCVMSQSSFRTGDTNRTRVTFLVVNATTGVTATEEARRMEAITAEVESRRAARAASATEGAKKTP